MHEMVVYLFNNSTYFDYNTKHKVSLNTTNKESEYNEYLIFFYLSFF